MLQVYVTPVPQIPICFRTSFLVVCSQHIFNTRLCIPHCICRQFGATIKKGTHKRLAEHGILTTQLTEWWRAVPAATETAEHF